MRVTIQVSCVWNQACIQESGTTGLHTTQDMRMQCTITECTSACRSQNGQRLNLCNTQVLPTLDSAWSVVACTLLQRNTHELMATFPCTILTDKHTRDIPYCSIPSPSFELCGMHCLLTLQACAKTCRQTLVPDTPKLQCTIIPQALQHAWGFTCMPP